MAIHRTRPTSRRASTLAALIALLALLHVAQDWSFERRLEARAHELWPEPHQNPSSSWPQVASQGNLLRLSRDTTPEASKQTEKSNATVSAAATTTKASDASRKPSEPSATTHVAQRSTESREMRVSPVTRITRATTSRKQSSGSGSSTTPVDADSGEFEEVDDREEKRVGGGSSQYNSSSSSSADEEEDEDERDRATAAAAARRRNRARRKNSTQTSTSGPPNSSSSTASAVTTTASSETTSTIVPPTATGPTASQQPSTTNGANSRGSSRDSSAAGEPTQRRRRLRPRPVYDDYYDDDVEPLPRERDERRPSRHRQQANQQPQPGPQPANNATATTPVQPESGSIANPNDAQNTSSVAEADVLGARSPGGPAQPNQSLTRRLTNMINDSKSKLMRLTSTTAKPTTASVRYPVTSTTMATTPGTTPANTIMPSNSSSNSSKSHTEEIALDDLDWTKLVKVVFTSPKDNNTVYTVVVNASELSQRVINDWSSEYPVLLQRDLDMLVGKWRNILPSDKLLAELNHMLAAKHLLIEAGNNSSSVQPTLNISANLLPGFNWSTQFDENFNKRNGNLSSNQNLSTNVGPKPSVPSGLPLVPANGTSNNNSTSDASGDRIKISTSESQLNKTVANSSAVLTNSGKQADPVTLDHKDTNGSNATKTSESNAAPSSGATNATIVDSAASNSSTVGNQKPAENAKSQNRAVVTDLMRNMNGDHSRIEDNVKEQANSLRHFIIICSIATVLATSLIVALIIVLLRR